jgi:hypothetical protein
LDNFQIPSKEHPSDHLPVAALLQFKRWAFDSASVSTTEVLNRSYT